MAAQNRRELTIVLTGDAKGLTGMVQISRQQLQQLSADLDKTGDTATRAGAKTASAFAKSGSAIDSARLKIMQFVGAAATVETLRGLGHMADDYANIGAQMRQAAAGAVSFTAAQDTAYGVAQRTNASLNSTADLISRVTRAMQGMGETGATAFAKSARIAESINQAVALSHVSATAADAALTQLSQGLASGVLRGDELNSVLEQTPRLAQAIADGMGVTVGQLRAQGQQGLITAQTVVNALESQAQTLKSEYGDLPLTIGRAWTSLTNAVERYVGQADQAAGASRLVAEGIAAIGANLGTLVATGMALALGQLGKLVAGFVSARAETVKAMLAQGALAEAELTSARAAEAETLAQLEKTKALAGAKASLVGVTEAEAAYAAAQARTVVATRAVGVASTVASTGLAGFGRGLLALAGGWVGVAVIALGSLAYAIYQTVQAEKDRQRELDVGIEQMHASANAARDMAAALTDISTVPFKTLPDFSATLGQWVQNSAALEASQDQLASKERELAQVTHDLAQAQSAASGYGGSLTTVVTALSNRSNELTREIDLLRPAMTDLGTQTNALGVSMNSVLSPALRDAANAAHDLLGNSDAGAWVQGMAGKLQQWGIQAGVLKDNAKEWNATNGTLAASMQTVNEKFATFGKTQAEVIAEQFKAVQATQVWNNATAKERAQLTAAVTAAEAHAKAMEKTKAPTNAAAKDASAVAAAYARLSDIQDRLAGKTDATTKAWNDSAAVIRDIAKIGATLIEHGVSETQVQQSLAGVLDDATAARNRDLAAAQRQMDVSGRLIDQIEQEAHASTLTARDQAAVRAGMQYEQEARQANLHLTQQQMDAEKARVEAAAANAFDMKKMADQQREVAQEYAGYWQNAASSISKEFGDTFTGQIHNLKDFASQGKSILQQWVSDIIAQFLRLRVLGPILSGAMGTVGGWLGIAGDLSGSSLSINNGYYGGGGIIGTTAGSVGDTGGAGGYAGYIQQGLQGYKLYNWATGLFGGSAAASPAYAGSASVINAAGNIGGNYGAMAGGMYAPGYAPVGGAAFNVGAPAYTPWGGSFSIGGYSAPYASAAGGLLGAYYGMHQGGGGISTGISTVGYGALGAGIAGTAAGVAGGASLGTAAGSAFGAAAASTSWIPIVGWIMAGLAALDHFSGGKVFGSGWKPAQSNVALNVGPDGSSASANELLWKYKGQTGLSLGGFLTGGLSQLSWWGDKKTKLKQLDVTPEMLQAAQQLYDSMSKVMVAGAQKLGTTVPDMITASLTAQTTYNKKGKAQGTEYLVQYLGQTWKEATAEAASQRLGADALLSVVAASAGDVAFKIAKQWQDSADTLADGVQTLLEAQQNIVRGNSLVALGSSATLKEVIAFTQGLQADGEKLADTYNRLMQASQAYEQFVGQFAPTSTSFGASLEAIAKQMQANIDQANQLAQAAGLQHAAESDLANIHKQAAEQAATAIAQLNSAAQDLAAKLYSVTNNTLSAVSAQLDKLAGKTQGALQLALGDNSPYNDKQKLDLALQGLRSGLTSADDVLSLGRKLYASSADYTGLYDKVQDILGLPGASGQQSLQDALKQYNGLYGQQQALQGQADATARFGDAKTLAQYVAEISTTHGIDYNEAASGLGFNLSDLAKDLGVTNIAGYLDQLKLQDIPGTTMDASASIVDAIQKLGRDLIQTITGAPLTSATGVTGSTSAATAEQTALLKSIDQRLAAIEESSSDTAGTNKTMVNQGASQKLNDLTRTSRGMLA